MMAFQTKVSALVVTNNRADMLSECIASVLSQTYPVYELIVIDDGSEEDIRAVTDSFSDPKIKYFRYERIGKLPKLRNIALSHATGEYAAFIDSDDRWHPEKIALHLDACEIARADISISDCQYFDHTGLVGQPIGKGLHDDTNLFHAILHQNKSFAFGTNLFFKMEIEGRRPKFDESLYSGDHDFMLMMCAWYKSVFIPKTLNLIRLHAHNMSRSIKVELTSTLEYNITLKKLMTLKKISLRDFNRISADNHMKSGASYLRYGLRRKAFRQAWGGLLFYPSWNNFKTFLRLTFFTARRSV